MFPEVFPLASGDAAVRAALGTSPVRFWPFASAPQKGQAGYAVPYAVWQFPYGTPENYLGSLPDIDNMAVQIDAYGETASSVRAAATALRNALQFHGHVVSYNGEEREAETGLYRVGFTVELWQSR